MDQRDPRLATAAPGRRMIDRTAVRWAVSAQRSRRWWPCAVPGCGVVLEGASRCRKHNNPATARRLLEAKMFEAELARIEAGEAS